MKVGLTVVNSVLPSSCASLLDFACFWGCQFQDHAEVARGALSALLKLQAAKRLLSYSAPVLSGCYPLVCRQEEGIIDQWLIVRYAVIGLYVGCATVGGFGWWFLSFSVRHPRSMLEQIAWMCMPCIRRTVILRLPDLLLRKSSSTYKGTPVYAGSKDVRCRLDMVCTCFGKQTTLVAWCGRRGARG